MIKKTKDYEMFIFRNDNREKIDKSHVKRLVDSISSRNLLELRPIVVNEKMEIIDGQHRVLAAQELGLDIYYQQEKKIEADDIIKMNITKSWTIGDYLNFYCKHNYPEYLKLSLFMKKHSLSLKVGITLALGTAHTGFKEFRNGEFKFDEQPLDEELSICWETIDYIKKMNGFSSYTSSSRFWKSLLKLVRHANFDAQKWRTNFRRMISNFCPQASTKDYEAMMQTVYNWKNNNKINISDVDV